MEKVIYALTMVEQLARSDLEFTFKGVTSLLLILPEPKRFSVDVDIVTTESESTLEKALNRVCQMGVFRTWERDSFRSNNSGVPKAHYQFSFLSQFDKREKLILLDVLFEDHGYPSCIQAPIENEWLDTDHEPVRVHIPSADSMAGDKLTAFAPHTIGIKFRTVYENGKVVEKQMEVMKQLFDIGILFDHIQNLEHFRQSYQAITEKEIEYRPNQNLSKESVVHDTIQTALMIASMGKQSPGAFEFQNIVTGLRQLKSYIYNGAFRIDEAVLAASKAAYLVAMASTAYDGPIHRWQEHLDIREYLIRTAGYQFLNKRKIIPGGSLFYWFHTLSLLNLR